MQITKKLLAIAIAGVVSCGSLLSDVSIVKNSITASATDSTNDDWLHAEGSRLYDKDGNEVWLTGANWFGFNCTECALHYLWSGDIDDMVESIANHGINVLRIPVSTELLYNWMIGQPDEMQSVNPNNDPYYPFNIDLINEDGTVMDSQGCFDVLLAKCKKYGVKVFIDIHSPESNNSGHNYGLWYGKSFTANDGTPVTVTTEVWTETLAWTADHYKNDDTLIGFDLKNEPHSTYGGAPVDAIWDDSTAENNWKNASQNCADAILEKNPNALIFIEGVEGYQGHGAWWGGNLRGVKDYPVTPTSGTSQIVYSPHDYGPIVSDQTWFNKDFTEQTLLDDYWYDTWAYIVDEDIAPLLIGEWGGRIPDGTIDEESLLSTASSSLDSTEKNVKWMILLRNYMINHHINHTFWCLNDDSGDTGGLWKDIQYNPTTGTTINWDTEKYNIFEKALWQTQTTGKYIGLDHQTALGDDGSGLSLSEFYSSYASTEGSNLDGGTVTNGSTGKGTAIQTGADDATTTTTATTPTTVLGDINKDEDVSLADSVELLNYLVGKDAKSTCDYKAGDVNSDDCLNGLDLNVMRQYLLGTIQSFTK